MTDSRVSRFSLSDLSAVREQQRELTPETCEPGAVRTAQPLVLVQQSSCRGAPGAMAGECSFSACLWSAACWEGVCAVKASVDRKKGALLRVQTNVCFLPFTCSGKYLQWGSYRIPLVCWSVLRCVLANTRLYLGHLPQVWNLEKNASTWCQLVVDIITFEENLLALPWRCTLQPPVASTVFIAAGVSPTLRLISNQLVADLVLWEFPTFQHESSQFKMGTCCANLAISSTLKLRVLLQHPAVLRAFRKSLEFTLLPDYSPHCLVAQKCFG